MSNVNITTFLYGVNTEISWWCRWLSFIDKDSQETGAYTFFLSSSFSMGSTAQHGFAVRAKSNLAYLQKPHALQRNGSFSS